MIGKWCDENDRKLEITWRTRHLDHVHLQNIQKASVIEYQLIATINASWTPDQQLVNTSSWLSVKELSSETPLWLAELVLTLNCFSFADSYFIQINGVAMGTKMGPSYANLFVGYIENQFFNQYNGPKTELYCSYIDDCIGATSSTRLDLNQFISTVNLFHIPGKFPTLL